MDPLAPLPAGPVMPSNAPPPSSLLAMLDQSVPNAGPMTLNVPKFALPAPSAGPGYDSPRKEATPWLGILADTLSGAMGRPGQYAAMQNQRRQEQTAFERGEEQYRRQRTDALSDDQRNYDQAIQLKQWERDNRQPTGYAAELEQAGIFGDERTKLLQQRARNSADPYVTVPMSNGTFSGPRSDFQARFGGGVTSPKPPPPQTAIEELRRDPSAAREFDEMFGPGASAQALGGAGSSAPRNFLQGGWPYN